MVYHIEYLNILLQLIVITVPIRLTQSQALVIIKEVDVIGRLKIVLSILSNTMALYQLEMRLIITLKIVLVLEDPIREEGIEEVAGEKVRLRVCLQQESPAQPLLIPQLPQKMQIVLTAEMQTEIVTEVSVYQEARKIDIAEYEIEVLEIRTHDMMKMMTKKTLKTNIMPK